MSRSVLVKFEAYLLTEKRVAKNTFAAYKRDLEQFIDFLLTQKIVLENVRVKDIKFFLRYLKTIEVGARSIARKVSSLKAFFSFMHERFGWENKAEDLCLPKFKMGLPTYLLEEEIEALLNVADRDTSELGVRNKIMLYLLYVSGMRISELVTMELSALHFDTGHMVIRGKGGKERMIPVPTDMMLLLRMYINDIHSLFSNKRPTNYLFPIFYAGNIKPISRQAFWAILKAMWSKTGIKKTISPHKLRHSLATHMLKNGANLRALQLMLGHENVATIQLYTHVEVSHMRTIYDQKHPRSE